MSVVFYSLVNTTRSLSRQQEHDMSGRGRQEPSVSMPEPHTQEQIDVGLPEPDTQEPMDVSLLEPKTPERIHVRIHI